MKRTSCHKVIALSLNELACVVMQALKIFGTDFTLISRVFAGRSRRQIKNKYTKENKVPTAVPPSACGVSEPSPNKCPFSPDTEKPVSAISSTLVGPNRQLHHAPPALR